MKELNCNLYGLSELTENEKMDTEGGILITAAFWLTGVAYKYFIAIPAWFFGSMGIGAY